MTDTNSTFTNPCTPIVGFSGLKLSIYVFMERAYMVGHVDNPQQAEAVLSAAKGVEGLRVLLMDISSGQRGLSE